MSLLQTVAKCLCSTSALTGTGMVVMGFGFLPLDEGLDKVARLYLDKLSVPTKPFLLVLGTCKILAVLKLWEIGPVPRKLALIGLATSALSGAYGHFFYEEKLQACAALFYAALVGYLYFTDSVDSGRKSD